MKKFFRNFRLSLVFLSIFLAYYVNYEVGPEEKYCEV